MKTQNIFYEFRKIIEGKLKEIIIENPDVARIAIVYDPGQYNVFPPSLAILNSSDIEECDQSDDFYESLWNPEEFSDYATPALSLSKKGENDDFFFGMNESYRLNQAIEKQAVNMYLECCVSIMEFSKKMNRNIIVFCTDPGLVELKSNVEKTMILNKNLNVVFPSWIK